MRGSFSTVRQWSVQVQYLGKCPVHYPEMQLSNYARWMHGFVPKWSVHVLSSVVTSEVHA